METVMKLVAGYNVTTIAAIAAIILFTVTGSVTKFLAQRKQAKIYKTKIDAALQRRKEHTELLTYADEHRQEVEELTNEEKLDIIRNLSNPK